MAEVQEEDARRQAHARVTNAEQEAATKYPGFKFIATDVMQEVCKKYGLIVGGVDRYKGEVPEWVLGVIERSGVPTKSYQLGVVYNGSGYVEYGRYASMQMAQDAAKGLDESADGKYMTHISSHSSLLIAAPAKEMEVNRWERVKNGRIVEVKDPIVCIEVTGGYCVIAAWGEEGQDPRVFNANVN